eukprot:TRINITY_DN14954_c0_g1_i1.p1 TRINITY_DN14954_c0_g1~~TRINITY_DN14954_c0_g1_i1.p1  ORF type:complete len:600 (+),score=129.01 TRINITY_DN14954_c0_g1_i1:64-1863(+)
MELVGAATCIGISVVSVGLAIWYSSRTKRRLSALSDDTEANSVSCARATVSLHVHMFVEQLPAIFYSFILFIYALFDVQSIFGTEATSQLIIWNFFMLGVGVYFVVLMITAALHPILNFLERTDGAPVGKRVTFLITDLGAKVALASAFYFFACNLLLRLSQNPTSVFINPGTLLVIGSLLLRFLAQKVQQGQIDSSELPHQISSRADQYVLDMGLNPAWTMDAPVSCCATYVNSIAEARFLMRPNWAGAVSLQLNQRMHVFVSAPLVAVASADEVVAMVVRELHAIKHFRRQWLTPALCFAFPHALYLVVAIYFGLNTFEAIGVLPAVTGLSLLVTTLLDARQARRNVIEADHGAAIATSQPEAVAVAILRSSAHNELEPLSRPPRLAYRIFARAPSPLERVQLLAELAGGDETWVAAQQAAAAAPPQRPIHQHQPGPGVAMPPFARFEGGAPVWGAAGAAMRQPNQEMWELAQRYPGIVNASTFRDMSLAGAAASAAGPSPAPPVVISLPGGSGVMATAVDAKSADTMMVAQGMPVPYLASPMGVPGVPQPYMATVAPQQSSAPIALPNLDESSEDDEGADEPEGDNVRLLGRQQRS